ncbi:MAG: transporter substrate-binding domain-containing protein [Paludibacter sp.]
MIKIKENIVQIFDFKRFLKLGKKLQIIIISGLLVAVFAVIMLIHSLNKSVHDLPTILKIGRITVLTDGSSVGFSKVNGNVSGFQYELVKAFADSLGVELVISEENDLKNGIEGLKSGDYDLIAMMVPITTEWKKDVAFSTPIQMSRQVLIQRQKPDSLLHKMISKHIQLGEDTVCISGNSPHKMRLEHLSNEIAIPIHVEEMKDLNAEQLVQLVSEGKIKYTICDELLALKLKKQLTNLDISVPIGFVQQEAWLVNPKSKKLLKKLNEFLSDFTGTTAYWNIYRKYYLIGNE